MAGACCWGRRGQLSEALPLVQTRVITYSYDGLLRLTGADASVGNDYTYSYDLAGNRTGVWLNGTRTITLTHDAANQVGGFSYDAVGNLTNDGTSTYGYDALNRLVQQGSTANIYNGDGVLVQSGATQYTQDLASPLSQMLQTINGGTTTEHLYGLDRLASTTGGTHTWYGNDALGSVRQTLDDNGTILSNVTYDPWGQVERGLSPGFGFTGELQDDAGMVYLRARWYNSSSGTFTARDPFDGFSEQPYSLNPYQYGYSDPVLNTDPSGKIIPYCPIGYRKAYKDGQFAGCEEDPNFPEWLWFLKGTTGPMPVGGAISIGGTLPGTLLKLLDKQQNRRRARRWKLA